MIRCNCICGPFWSLSVALLSGEKN